jgi:histidine triad (HIT) family protein
LLDLAGRTPGGCSPPVHSTPQGLLALETRLTVATVHLKSLLIVASLSIGVHKISQGGATGCDAFLQDRHDCVRKLRQHLPPDPMSASSRPYACNVQRLVDIDVAETSQEPLIEQGGFHRGSAVLEPLSYVLDGEFCGEWVDAQFEVLDHGLWFYFRNPEDSAKLANISVVQKRSVVQLQTDMSVFVRRVLQSALQTSFLKSLEGRIGPVRQSCCQLTGHAQVNAQRDFVQGKEKKLPVAARLGEPLALEPSSELFGWLAPQYIGVANNHPGYLTVFNSVSDASSYGLDFWKFRHRKGCLKSYEWARMSTVFTKIISGDLPGHFVCRDDKAVAFLSINPIRPGHVLIVPIEEVSHWVDLDPELNAHLMKMAQRVARAQMKVLKPERVGMIIAGFEVPHTHLHVVPVDSEGQLSFAYAARSVDHDELKKIAHDLTQALA